MFDKEKRKQMIIIAAIIVAFLALIIVKIIDKHYEKSDNRSISASKFIEENDDKTTNEKIKVYITGEVQNEGVIELDAGSRIVDAIEKAGGQTEQADIKNVNLAYELEDGQKIYIPNKNEIGIENIEIIDDGADGIVGETTKTQTININKADINQLQTLPGIGQSLAEAIIKHREENGNYRTPEDLKQVPGIGDSKYETIKDYIKIK